jgi:uncharacterized protein with PQ loop repeat
MRRISVAKNKHSTRRKITNRAQNQVPQLIENYRNGNAEAISFLFILVWFIGDIANLFGGLLAGLVPVIVAIAVYFCIADGVLIAQCLYYKARNSRLEAHHRRRSSVDTPDPTTPLLGRRFSDTIPPTQSRRRSSGSLRGYQAAAGRRESQTEDPLAKIVEENEFGRKAWVKNLVSVLGIFLVGMAGWTMAWQTGMWAPAPLESHNDNGEATSGQMLGYFSAICYLGYVYSDFSLLYGLGLTNATARDCLRSIRITATSPAKDCPFCSSFFPSWATLPTVQVSYATPPSASTLSPIFRG